MRPLGRRQHGGIVGHHVAGAAVGRGGRILAGSVMRTAWRGRLVQLGGDAGNGRQLGWKGRYGGRGSLEAGMLLMLVETRR